MHSCPTLLRLRQPQGKGASRSPVELCWLGMLFRVAESTTGGTWRNLGHELDRMHLVTLEPSEARLVKPSTATKPQREILAAGGSRTLPEPRP